MSFSYDPSLDTDLDRVRFALADTVKEEGPKPNNGNFQNEELRQLLTSNGKWQLAVADGFDVLASEWASDTTFSVHNGSFSNSDASARYASLAQQWRERYGEVSSAPAPTIKSGLIARSDGYS